MTKRRPKITLFHCSFIYTGGGERIAFGQMDGLREKGYRIECFAPVMDKKLCYPDIINKYPVKTLLPQLPSWFPFHHGILLLATSALMPLLAFRFKNTDLFLGENQPGTWLAFVCAKVLKKPYLVYTCHPNKMVYPRRLSRKQIWKNQKDFYWLSLFFEPFKPILRGIDRISFVSSKSPVLVNGFFIGREFGRIYQVPWLGCPSGAPYIKEEGKIIKNNRVFEGEVDVGGIKIKKPFILYVGRHEVWKRIDLAIKSMVKTVKRFPDVRLVIRGPFSSHTEDLKALAKKLGLEKKIIFSEEKGKQEEVRDLYFNAAVYVFPSKKEDFGIVIIEAMGAGVPVVAWNSGGPTDIVLDGETGFLAKPFSLADFSQKVVKILKDRELRHRMSLASWKRVRNDFSWGRHIEILDGEIKKKLDCQFSKNPLRFL